MWPAGWNLSRPDPALKLGARQSSALAERNRLGVEDFERDLDLIPTVWKNRSVRENSTPSNDSTLALAAVSTRRACPFKLGTVYFCGASSGVSSLLPLGGHGRSIQDKQTGTEGMRMLCTVCGQTIREGVGKDGRQPSPNTA